MLNVSLGKKNLFSYNLDEQNFDKNADLGDGKSFQLLTSEHLLKMTAFREMIDFDIFCRDPKKSFSPLEVSLLDS